MAPGKDCNETPTAEEIRAAVGRIAASSAFCRSPQLVAFLRFVVELTLAGKAEHIKSYTIGVEAFGRGEHFDPQIDPIVRVEAARLRKALTCYFAGEGDGRSISIEIPLGSYVPEFSRRNSRSSVVIAFAAFLHRLRWQFNARPGYTARSKVLLLGGLLVVSSLVTLGLWSSAMPLTDEIRAPASAGPTIAATKDRRALVSVQPVVVSGVPPDVPNAPEKLQSKLLHTLARFDEIKVVAELGAQTGTTAAPADLYLGRSNYRLRTTLEYRTDGTVRLLVLLDDVTAGTIIWANIFDAGRFEKYNDDIEDVLVGDIATMLAQPYGVIYAEEVAKKAVDGVAERYGCWLQMLELRRIENPELAERTRACLERATTRDPRYAHGFAALSLLEIRNYYLGDGGDRALIDRAVAAASRAVELKPQSARAHQALSAALFARGDIAYALRQGAIAVSLNPNDMTVLAAYGMRLAGSGQLKEGAALLSQAAKRTSVPDPALKFALFVCAYLLGDNEKTSYYASTITSDTFPPALLVQALAAARAGDPTQAQQIIARLSEMHPLWRTQVRSRLQRFIPSAAIVDRLAGDISMIGRTAER
jgi:tetratricopeptide (TPR) repeat protein